MVRKEPKKWSTVSLEKSTIKKLEDYKIHPNQSLNEIIKEHLIKQKEVIENVNRNDKPSVQV